MNTIKIRKPVLNAVIWLIPQLAAFGGALAVGAWVASALVHRVEDLHGLVITLLSAGGAWAVLGMAANDIAKTITGWRVRRTAAATETAYRDLNPAELEVKENALKTAEYRLSGIDTDADQIAAADAIYRWITDPAADRRVREAAHRNLHNRLNGCDKPSVSEFLERAEAYERFLTTHEDEAVSR